MRLRPFPPCHPKMRTIKYGPESQAQGRISPQKACSIRSNGKTPRREVVAGPGRSPRTSYYTGDRGFPPTRLYPPRRGGYRGQEEVGGSGRRTRRRPKRAGGASEDETGGGQGGWPKMTEEGRGRRVDQGRRSESRRWKTERGMNELGIRGN